MNSSHCIVGHGGIWLMKFRQSHGQNKGSPKEDHKDAWASGEHAQWGMTKSNRVFSSWRKEAPGQTYLQHSNSERAAPKRRLPLPQEAHGDDNRWSLPWEWFHPYIKNLFSIIKNIIWWKGTGSLSLECFKMWLNSVS